MYNIIFNNKVDKDLGIKIIKRPNIPAPKRRYREIQIEGRDGKLYEDLETYDDIEIDVQYNFISEDYNATMREIKKWINNVEDNRLKFSDDLEFFYIVKKVTIETNERVIKRLGKFTIKFTCKPFSYLESGLNPIEVVDTIYNDGYMAEPIYKITGEGICTLKVNGKTVIANVGQSLIIDVEKKIAYREDRTLQNTALKGLYEDLELQEGNNTIEVSKGFVIEIIPNWRCL